MRRLTMISSSRTELLDRLLDFPVLRQEFPDLYDREFCVEPWCHWIDWADLPKRRFGIAKFPVLFPVGREFSSRDGFGIDCVRHQRSQVDGQIAPRVSYLAVVLIASSLLPSNARDQTAVNPDHRTGDVGGTLAGKKSDRVGIFLRIAVPPGGN